MKKRQANKQNLIPSKKNSLEIFSFFKVVDFAVFFEEILIAC